MPGPNRLRHFINYHNPDVMNGDFRNVNVFAILTNKKVRDLKGDVVWMIGREEQTSEYFLYGRFRVESVLAADHKYFEYEIGGSTGLWFRPPIHLNVLPWFQSLKTKTANFSTGFQSIKDEDVLIGLQALKNSASPVRATEV